jgi:hypothetical protein
MNCQEVEQRDILGAYIAGKLPEAERDSFEEHFFGCDACLRDVEAARIAREVLLKQPSARLGTWWIGLAAAAAVIVGAIVFWPAAKLVTVEKPVAKAAEPSYELLARFDAPVYRASTLRGAEKTARAFRDAMKLYSAGDFAGAAAGLRSVDSVEAKYYLGVSELLAGDRAGGVDTLRQVVAAGDTPFLSGGRFYLAKGLIGAGDLPGAREHLAALVRDRSELAPRAQELLGQLGK